MTQRIWNGGYGDWYSAIDWDTSVDQTGTPVPGDTLTVQTGTVTLLGSEAQQAGLFNDAVVDLGSASGATLDLEAAVIGASFTIDGLGSFSLLSSGESAFDGSLSVGSPTDVVTLGSLTGGGGAGSLTFLPFSAIDIAHGATLDVDGPVTIESVRTGNEADELVVGSTLSLIGSALTVLGITGTGTVDLLLGSKLVVEGVIGDVFPGVAGSVTIAFQDAAATLSLYNASDFAGAVTGFAPGDTIDLKSVGDTAAYDPAQHELTLTTASSGAVDAVLQNITAASGALLAVPDGSGGTDIVYASASSALTDELASGDRAMGSELVRADMTVPGTSTPITGAGVKIGIISDSFDYAAGGPDPANAAAAAGLIPANATGTSAVQVLTDYDTAYSTNEGLAMAELIHQVAPGAALAFASGETSLAAAVTALQNAGCTIIVDDLGSTPAPVYQVTGPVDQAVSNAIASGIDYFTSAGNSYNNFLSTAFTPTTVTLSNGEAATANLFDNGTVYEGIDPIDGATYLNLNWAAPYFGPGDAGAPDELTMELFNSSGSVVETSSQSTDLTDAGTTVRVAEDYIYVPSGGPYTLAILQNGSVAPGQFLLTDNDQDATIIEDPQTGIGVGEVSEQELIPGVNTVGAVPYASSPVYGQNGVFPETFSDGGPGEILYDSSGNLLSTPISAGKVDFAAPDAEDTSVVSPTGFDFAPFTGTSAAAPDAAAVAALMLQANPNLTTSQVTQILEQSAIPLTNTPAAEGGAGLIQAVPAVELAEQTPCYAAGTRILTERGEVAVEHLRIGERVVSAFGGTVPIKWLGRRRIDIARHPRPAEVLPVRIAAGAFGVGADGTARPCRPLRLSPDHAVYVDDVLIPVRCLIDGRAIVQEMVETVTYWHIELPCHDVIVADGMTAESWLDTGNRAAFDNAAVTALHPAFAHAAQAAWDHAACADLVERGPVVERVRAALAERAERLGLASARMMAVDIGGTGRIEIAVPAGVRTVRLRSPAGRIGADRRALGVLVRWVSLDGAVLPLDGPGLGLGFHPMERHGAHCVRWTDGDAHLHVGASDAARLLAVEIAGVAMAA